jgi:hypothetical protein
MAVISVIKPDVEAKSQVYRFFISYAREDEKIAIAVYNALETAMGPSAKVFIDSGLRFGLSFQDEIKKKLEETDTLVVIDSAVLKPAFGYTGMELGYFISVMGRDLDPQVSRRIVPIYLEKPPDILSGHEGMKIGISHDTLSLTFEEYEASLSDIDYNHPTVRFLREFQNLVDKVRERRGAPKIPRSEDQQDLPGAVKKMQLAIFSHLKTTPEVTLKPQKQLMLRTSDDALNASDGQLPKDTLLIPVGAGNPMSIFGLPSNEMSWEEFQGQTKQDKFRDSWVDAITSVVMSALQSQLDVDNSQLLVSHDEKHAYRVILTTGTKYFNGVREFNLYFVEYLKRPDFGDQDTTVLFKGLELLCRFRSLFLERKSEFSSMSFRIANPSAIKDMARSVERELNLLRRDAIEVGLDRAPIWAEFVDWERLLKMAEVWRPLDIKVRQILSDIRRSEPDAIEDHRKSLVETLQELEKNMRPLNAGAIAEMSEKLKGSLPAN